MSFGQAAARRGIHPPAGAPCPCGGPTFGTCCGPIIGGAPAATAEQLMRSRYTAFAIGDAAHVAATWHPSTRPEPLDLDGDIRWQALEILSTEAGGPEDDRGVVEFRAHHRDAEGRLGSLHERSRFRRQRGRWWYVDGVVDA
ncbi:YchJ family protein [Microbacterium sp. MC2]